MDVSGSFVNNGDTEFRKFIDRIYRINGIQSLIENPVDPVNPV